MLKIGLAVQLCRATINHKQEEEFTSLMDEESNARSNKDKSQTESTDKHEGGRQSGNDTQPMPSETVTTAGESKTKRNMFLLFGAFVLIAGGVAGGWWLGSNSNDDDGGNDEMTVQEEVANTSTLTQADLEATKTVWDADTVAILSAYDQTNDNVGYVFSEDTIQVTGNGLPDHDTGEFPNNDNPNTISEQSVDYSIPREPIYNGTATDVRIYGITLGGIPIEPATAETDSETGWNIEAFNMTLAFGAGVDFNNAHVQPNGTYHYHGVPTSLVTSSDDEHSNLIGFAADGFPIYSVHGYSDPTDASSVVTHLESSWQLREGARADGEPAGTYNGDYTQDYEFVEGSGDLDECNGRFTLTPEFPNGTYAYFFTEDFPYAGRCVMGEVAEGFNTGPGGGGAPGAMQPQGPPPQGPQAPPQ